MIRVHDETLRDGVQSPSVVDPSIEDKLRIIHQLDRVGVDSVNIGLPAAGPRAFDDALRLAREIADSGLSIRPGCAARTTARDITPIVEISQRTGIAVEVFAFIGSSPIRALVENRPLRSIRYRTSEAIRGAVQHGLTATYVTEDTTRSRPDVLDDLFRAAIDSGADRLCLCDTTGHATPDGARNLVAFTRQLVTQLGVDVGIDWHGHEDRGLALANALTAVEAGADRIHACVLGIGERVGNTPLELALLNLSLEGKRPGQDLAGVPHLCRLVARATGRELPAGPLPGADRSSADAAHATAGQSGDALSSCSEDAGAMSLGKRR